MVLLKDSFSGRYSRNNWLTRADEHCAEFCRHTFCPCRSLLALNENNTVYVLKCMSTFSTFSVCFVRASLSKNSTPRRLTLCGVELFELIIRISLRKRFFKQNSFSLLVRGSDGFDLSNEKSPKILVTLPL